MSQRNCVYIYIAAKSDPMKIQVIIFRGGNRKRRVRCYKVLLWFRLIMYERAAVRWGRGENRVEKYISVGGQISLDKNIKNLLSQKSMMFFFFVWEERKKLGKIGFGFFVRWKKKMSLMEISVRDLAGSLFS